MAPVKLPSYVIFVGHKGDDVKNLGHTVLEPENKDFLQFKTTERNKTVSHEVIPVQTKLPAYKDVVMIKSLDNDNYWRCDRELDSNWIRADKSDIPELIETDCLFKVVRVNHTTAALLCLGNDLYLKRQRRSEQTDVDCLAAKAEKSTDLAKDVTTHLRVTAALSNRKVFDVEYDMENMEELPNSKPVTLGFKTARNDTSVKKDIPVKVPFTVESKYSWRTVTTFDTDLDLIVKARIPDFKTKSLHDEESRRVKNGKLYPAEKHDFKPYTFKAVAAGETRKVEIKGSRAIVTVPFNYKFGDQRVGETKDEALDEQSGNDGVFVGEQVRDIDFTETAADLEFSISYIEPPEKLVESDSSGTPK